MKVRKEDGSVEVDFVPGEGVAIRGVSKDGKATFKLSMDPADAASLAHELMRAAKEGGAA